MNQPIRTEHRRLEICVVRKKVIEADTILDGFLQEILFIEEKDDGAIAEEAIIPN